MGGQLTLGCGALPPIVAPVKAGKLRGIAVTSLKRAQALPDVPTVVESGFAGYEDYTWIAFFAPAGTPRAIVEKLNRDIDRVLKLPDVKERLAVLAFDYTPNTPQQFAEFTRRELDHWGKVIRGARITVE